MTLRAPLITPVSRRAAQEGSVSVNLLLTVLAVAASAVPFKQSEWSNPQARAVRQDSSWIQNLQQATLSLPVSGTPFNQSEWSGPQTRVARQDSLWIQSLLQTTLLAVGQAPFSKTDWPNPARIAGQDSSLAQNLQQTTLAVAVSGTPFVKNDWPNPLIRAVNRSSDSLNLLGTTLAGVAQNNFTQTDWPNPQARFVAQAAPVPNTLLTVLDVATPFRVEPWANPVTLVPTPQGFIAQNLLATTLIPLQAVPFSQADWPVYSKVVRSQATDSNNILITTLTAVAVGDPPFRLTEWPNPLRFARRPTVDVRNQLPLLTLPAPQVGYPPSVTILALPYVDATIQAFSAVSVTIQAYPAPDENLQAKSAVMVEINTDIPNQWVDARISTAVYASDVYEPDVYE